MSRKIKVEMKSDQTPIFIFVSGVMGQYRIRCGCGYDEFTLDHNQKISRCGKCKVVLATHVTNDKVDTDAGNPLFFDALEFGTFRVQCLCGFNEFLFTKDKSCFCCADCKGIIAKRELCMAQTDMSKATWVL